MQTVTVSKSAIQFALQLNCLDHFQVYFTHTYIHSQIHTNPPTPTTVHRQVKKFCFRFFYNFALLLFLFAVHDLICTRRRFTVFQRCLPIQLCAKATEWRRGCSNSEVATTISYTHFQRPFALLTLTFGCFHFRCAIAKIAPPSTPMTFETNFLGLAVLMRHC